MKCVSCGCKFSGDSSSSDRKDYTALTEEPVLLEEGTDGSLGKSGKYVLFGDWPQSLKKDDVTIDESKTYKVNAWDCYKGSDGCFYVKEIAKPHYSGIDEDCCEIYDYEFSNGKPIIKNIEYFFKLESIKWRVLENNYGGGKLLLAENVLIISMFDSHVDRINCKEVERTINGKIIHANNYEYSHIRAYLNGLNGSSYDVKDFTNNGFINKAFSKRAIERIKTVTVDNSASSTIDSDKNLDYVCDNTQDKVFLLSDREVTNASYGFDAYDKFIGDDFGTTTSSRSLQTTDYSLAIGAYAESDERYKNSCYFWLRSPYDVNCVARIVNWNGQAEDFLFVDETDGVVPALSISF